MPAVTTVQGNYFLANNETLALAANLSNVNVFGYVGGVSELDLQSSDSNITVNANVSRIGFSDALSAYTFQAQGNTVNVYLQSSGSLVANIDVGTNGSLLSFGGTGFGPTATQPLALRVVPASGSALLQITLDGQPLSNAGAISIGSAPTPPTSPTTPPVSPTMALTVAGDTVNLSGTTAASTVALTGADLTAFPSATFGTVAQLVGVGITSVTNSGGNFMLNASGNLNATTFNFGTGVVSGADAASSTGITYLGVTTYVAGNAADNVTGAASGNFAVNLGALTYTGTVAFGASGNDTIKVSGNSNISGATITSGGASVGLVFNAAGTETLNTAQYNLFNATSITGGTFGGNTIAFSNAGTVTANANVGSYNLSSAGNTIALTNAANNVTGAASGNDTVNLAALAYTGTLAFGASGSDSVQVTVGGDISAGTITSGGAAVGLVLSGAGTETLNTAQYNLFNATSITGGTFGGNTIAFSNAGTVTANANVGSYNLSSAGNTIALTNAANNVTGAASGTDIVDLAGLTYTGTVSFGASGNDTIKVSGNSNISGATITSGGASVGLVFNAAGTETLNTAQYNLFNATSITGGTFGGNTIAFSNAGTVSDNINVGNYHLSSAGNTISLNNAGDTVTGAATGGDNYKILSTSFTGSLHLGSSGADTVTIDLTANHTISGGSISSGGTSANLVLSGSGTLTVSSAEAATFHASNSAIVASGTDTMNIGDASSIVNLNAHENALNTVGLQAAFSNVNISIGAASVNAGAAGFNQSVTESALTGHDTFNINNGSATITGAVDATHYVTINGFNTSSDQMVLTLSGVNQNGTSQTISDSGNDVITAGNNGLIYLSNLGALLGYVVANANDLSSAETNILAAVDATTASTGVYTFAIDTNNGAALYQTHFTGSTLDGIQLVGVVSGTAVFSMIGHIS